MRLALVEPPQPYFVTPGLGAPVALHSLAAAVRAATAWHVDVLDQSGWRSPEEAPVPRGYDVVGYTAMSLSLPIAQRCARRVRQNDEPVHQAGTTLILGGAHVTITHDRPDPFEVFFEGPAERTLPMYLSDREAGRGHGVYIGNLNDAELEVLPLPVSPPYYHTGLGKMRAGVMTGRGCPSRCAFCATEKLYWKPMRMSAKRALEWVRFEVEAGAEHIVFYDDNFMGDRERAKEIIEGMRDIGATWEMQMRVSDVCELPELRTEAGCTGVSLGVESFDDRVLKALRKGTTVAQAHEALTRLEDWGLPVRMLLMIGTPGETAETVARNITALQCYRDNLAHVLLFTFMPYPGCDIREHPERYGIKIEDPDTSKYVMAMWTRDSAGMRVETPLWSPIRIQGMTYTEQLDNMRAMRAYVKTLPEMNRG